MNYEILIHADRLDGLKQEINKLNKKAEKYNIPAISYSVGNVVFVNKESKPVYVDETKERSFYDQAFAPVFKKVTVYLNLPEFIGIPGYTLIGRVVKEQGKTLVWDLNDNTKTPVEFRDPDFCRCDHCGKRINRAGLFILQDKTGKFTQVGDTCVNDYAGIDCLNAVSQYAIMRQASEHFSDEFGDNGNGPDPLWNTYEILQLAFLRAKFDGGFVSKSMENIDPGNPSTLNRIKWIIYRSKPFLRTNKKGENFEDFISDNFNEGWNKAREITKYIHSVNPGDNNYHYNLQQLLTNEYTTEKNYSMVVSAVGFWANKTGYFNQSTNNNMESVFYGTPGQKFDGIKCTCTGIASINTAYGKSMIYTFKTGNSILVWFSSNELNIVLDQKLTLKGSIKEHKTYKGINQTLITRCKVM